MIRNHVVHLARMVRVHANSGVTFRFRPNNAKTILFHFVDVLRPNVDNVNFEVVRFLLEKAGVY